MFGNLFNRPIKNYINYSIYNDGRVWSRNRGGHFLKQTKDSHGYPKVGLSQDGKQTTRLVAHLVAEAFIGLRPNGCCVCHCDGNPTNSRLDNLRYDTLAENQKDRNKHNTNNKGERNGRRKITDSDVRAIRIFLTSNEITQKEIGARFGIARSTISQIKSGLIWKQ